MPKRETINTSSYYPWNQPAAGLHYSASAKFFPFSSFVTEGGRPKRKILIGRSPKCPIRIRDDDRASNIHAVLERQSHGLMQISDPGATNRIYIDKQRIVKPVILMIGMRIRLGDTLLIATNETGAFPVWGFTVDEFCANAVEEYGSGELAGDRVGRSGEMVRQKFNAKAGKPNT